jgi:hypothetical protein
MTIFESFPSGKKQTSVLLSTSIVQKSDVLLFPPWKEVYEGEVTEVTPIETESSYGRTILFKKFSFEKFFSIQ